MYKLARWLGSVGSPEVFLKQRPCELNVAPGNKLTIEKIIAISISFPF